MRTHRDDVVHRFLRMRARMCVCVWWGGGSRNPGWVSSLALTKVLKSSRYNGKPWYVFMGR